MGPVSFRRVWSFFDGFLVVFGFRECFG